MRSFKRANNILTQAERQDGVEYSFGTDEKLIETDAERVLLKTLEVETPKIVTAVESEDFITAMKRLASLRGPVDQFFEAVQVNTENQILRRNRLSLLSQIRSTCLSVADLSLIEG